MTGNERVGSRLRLASAARTELVYGPTDCRAVEPVASEASHRSIEVDGRLGVLGRAGARGSASKLARIVCEGVPAYRPEPRNRLRRRQDLSLALPFAFQPHDHTTPRIRWLERLVKSARGRGSRHLER
jgi:hypothetical protein